MSETDKSLAAHVRELVGRLECITTYCWYGNVYCRVGGFRVVIVREFEPTQYIESSGVGERQDESLACTAASAAVAKWLGENGYDAPARDGGRE